MKSIRFSLLSGLLTALLVAGCGGQEGTDAPSMQDATASARTVRVETLVLTPTDFEDAVELSGTIEALNDATLSAQTAGTVTYLAELGRSIGAGGLVAQLDAGVAQAAVQQAQAQVNAAQAALDLALDNFRRQQTLFRDSIISAIEFENVKAQRNQAQAQRNQAQAVLAQAREQLRNTRVVTPFPAVVEQHFVQRGEQVTPGRQVVRVVNVSRVKVRAGVPERFAGEITLGTPVEIGLQAYDGTPRAGRVTFVGSAVDPQSRTFPVEIELANPDGRLKPAMVVGVRLPRARLEGVLVLPRAAILRDEDGESVYVVERTDSALVARRRSIVTGPGSGGDVVVLSGLEAGDEVIVLGQTNVAEGAPLEVASRRRDVTAPADSLALSPPVTNQ